MYLVCADRGLKAPGSRLSRAKPPVRLGPERRPVFLMATPQGSAESQGPYTHEVGEGRREPLTLGAPLLGIMTGEPAADLNWDVRTDLSSEAPGYATERAQHLGRQAEG